MADLSPAAQAVLDAANQAYDEAATVAQGTAAALRAAADQVAPAPPGSKPGTSSLLKAIRWERKTTREQLLAIAAELEGNVKSESN
jgi:hypothetical protein